MIGDMENQPKPKFQGKFVFDGIMEDSGEDKRTITFKPPLVVNYTIFEKLDKDTGKPNYPEDVPLLAYATFDFGMMMMTPLNPENNWLTNGYNGLTKDSPVEDILMNSVIFDIFHALCHETQDPNYSHYHFALKGWLKDRATVSE